MVVEEMCHMKRKVKTRDKTWRGKMSHFATFYPLSSQKNYKVKTRGRGVDNFAQ